MKPHDQGRIPAIIRLKVTLWLSIPPIAERIPSLKRAFSENRP